MAVASSIDEQVRSSVAVGSTAARTTRTTTATTIMDHDEQHHHHPGNHHHQQHQHHYDDHGDYCMDRACNSMSNSIIHHPGRPWSEASDARPLLPKAAFFMGDLRDGLPMLNMQAAFLISAKNFSEKQIGGLFLAFGLSQFVFMTPAGYFLDYARDKINWVIFSGAATSLLTVASALLAHPGGDNMGLMVLLKVVQGGVSTIIPPGFNSVTLGIVGATGFTHQVSRNRMMNHVGTAMFVAIASVVAYFLYPNIGVLFMVSPLAMIGVYYNLVRIKPNHVDPDAARALIIESPTMTEYEHLETQSSMAVANNDDDDDDDDNDDDVDGDTGSSESPSEEDAQYAPPTQQTSGSRQQAVSSSSNQPGATSLIGTQSNESSRSKPKWSYGPGPSFNLGWGDRNSTSNSDKAGDGVGKDMSDSMPRARTPLAVLLSPTLVTFTLVMFTFHLANSSVLPLVMQSLAVEDEKSGILLSGMCILIGQGFMSWFAKICGDFSPKWGRKGLTLFALASLTFRCFFLTMLIRQQDYVKTDTGGMILKALILSTQLLDSITAGIIGTMHILVTNDISCKTGRFSLMMGVTTGAMCLGATVSGFIGQTVAQDYGYAIAFACLGALSLLPLSLYAFCMPETLPDFAKPESRKKRLLAILKKLNEQRRKLNPFRRRRRHHKNHNNPTATVQLMDDVSNQDGLMAPSSNAVLV
jgi:MFS family permease